MGDLQMTFTEDTLTFTKRLGWVNENKAPTRDGRVAGEVTHFNTRFGLPVVVPDQWEDQRIFDEEGNEVGVGAVLEPIPHNIAVIALVPSDNSPSIKVWHDDIRRPPDNSWAWCRTNDDARQALTDFRVREISLDHDLGLHNADPDLPDADLQRLPDGERPEEGWELAEWMVENGLVPPKVTIHSWNPVGAERMARILKGHCAHLNVKPYERRT